MYTPRTISMIASSFIIAVVIIAIVFYSHFEWHQYKEHRKYHPPTWKYVFSILITAVTSTAIMGFNISLLVFSISYDEKWIEVLLLLSGRVLLMQHVRIYFQSQTIYWRDLGGISLEISPGNAHSIYIPARIMGQKIRCNSRPSSLDRPLCIGLLLCIYYLHYRKNVTVSEPLSCNQNQLGVFGCWIPWSLESLCLVDLALSALQHKLIELLPIGSGTCTEPVGMC